jgi:CRP-like cAMP-binding protein
LPKEVDAIVLRALEKAPEKRYPTWTEFSLALSNLVEKILPPGVIPDSEKYVAVKKVPMLSGLSDSELWEMALSGKWSEVPAKMTIVKENDKGMSFFLVGKGQVKVTRQGKLLNTLDACECFGEMAYIRGGEMPRYATVESATELLLVEFDPATLAKMSIGAQLHLTRALVRNLVDRLEQANTRMAR